MLEIFTHLADWTILQLGLTKNTHLSSAVHFFVEDSVIIFVLLYVLIFIFRCFVRNLVRNVSEIIYPVNRNGKVIF